MSTHTTHHESLFRHTGWAFWPIAFIARLPFAMMTVGVLTLVASATGSVALAGLTSAAVGIGVVVAGPAIGSLADRFGQRAVLIPIGIANALLLGAFPFLVVGGASEAVTLALALAIGLTAPQAAAMSRSRLLTLVRARLHPDTRERAISRVQSYESAADETAFVIGPFLVGILAAAIAPWAPIALAAVLALIFVTAFALHPTATVAAEAENDVLPAPMREVLRGRVLVLVAATFAVGAFFGATLTSLTAFAQQFGDEAIAGLLYGLMGLGSAALALGVALLPARFTLRARWLAFAAVMLLSAVAYAAVTGLGAMIAALLLMGLGVGPTLVTLFSLAGARTPRGRSATTMTLLGSALVLAQALAAAVTGWIAENVSLAAAMALPAVAASVVVVLGAVNVWGSRRAVAAARAAS